MKDPYKPITVAFRLSFSFYGNKNMTCLVRLGVLENYTKVSFFFNFYQNSIQPFGNIKIQNIIPFHFSPQPNDPNSLGKKFVNINLTLTIYGNKWIYRRTRCMLKFK